MQNTTKLLTKLVEEKEKYNEVPVAPSDSAEHRFGEMWNILTGQYDATNETRWKRDVTSRRLRTIYNMSKEVFFLCSQVAAHSTIYKLEKGFHTQLQKWWSNTALPESLTTVATEFCDRFEQQQATDANIQSGSLANAAFRSASGPQMPPTLSSNPQTNSELESKAFSKQYPAMAYVDTSALILPPTTLAAFCSWAVTGNGGQSKQQLELRKTTHFTPVCARYYSLLAHVYSKRREGGYYD